MNQPMPGGGSPAAPSAPPDAPPSYEQAIGGVQAMTRT